MSELAAGKAEIMRLFVSYARDNKELVKENVIDVLKDAGYDVWFDHDIPVGEDWEKEIIKNIGECDVFVYAVTPKSLKSKHCQFEREKAIEFSKHIIPVMLEKCEDSTKPIWLKKTQHVDFTNGATKSAIGRLMKGLKDIEANRASEITTQAEGSARVRLDSWWGNGLPSRRSIAGLRG